MPRIRPPSSPRPCPVCRYDTRQLTRNICPECGTPVELEWNIQHSPAMPLSSSLVLFVGGPLLLAAISVTATAFMSWAGLFLVPAPAWLIGCAYTATRLTRKAVIPRLQFPAIEHMSRPHKGFAVYAWLAVFFLQSLMMFGFFVGMLKFYEAIGGQLPSFGAH